jgi:hypothetical protein
VLVERRFFLLSQSEMPRKAEALPDVRKLLEFRAQVAKSLLGPENISSVTAFLCWKALLLAANTELGKDEFEKVDALVRNMLATYPSQLRLSLRRFVAALRQLGSPEISHGVRTEWLRKDYWPLEETERRVQQTLRSIRRLHADLDAMPDEALAILSDDIAAYLRHVRNITIGHAQVLTNMGFFPQIVGAFEDLVAQMAMLRHQEFNHRG